MWEWSIPVDLIEAFKRGNPRKRVGPDRENLAPEERIVPMNPFEGTEDEIEAQADKWAANELAQIKARYRNGKGYNQGDTTAI